MTYIDLEIKIELEITSDKDYNFSRLTRNIINLIINLEPNGGNTTPGL